MSSHRLMQLGHFELWPTFLVESGDAAPALTDFQQLFDWLRRAHDGIQWWVGDAVNLLEQYFPDEAAQIIDASDWDENTVRTYRWVCRSVPPAHRLAGVPFGHYVNGLAALPQTEQVSWAERVVHERLSQSALRTALRVARFNERTTTRPLPPGRFRVLYAAPPWPYDDLGPVPEPAVSIPDLCALPIRSLAEDDAVLFLWVTATALLRNPGAREVIEAWGFSAKTGMVWDRILHAFNPYLSLRHEHLILATRGTCPPERTSPMPDSVYAERGDASGASSRKPAYFRALIDHLYPTGRALELFAIDAADPSCRWTTYGDAAPAALVPHEGRGDAHSCAP